METFIRKKMNVTQISIKNKQTRGYIITMRNENNKNLSMNAYRYLTRCRLATQFIRIIIK